MNNTKNFVVYKSSAGSGKTYTLVREYISLALTAPGYFRHILAVTFTNKAANEMKQRVVQSLMHLAHPEAFSDSSTIKHMWNDLSAMTGFQKEDIPSKASAVLSTLLHEYDDFAIRTIDSFVTRIIRTFAHDLHLPVDFEIEMDKDVLLEEAVDKLMAKAGVDQEITRILVEFTETKAEDEKSWHIETDLKKIGEYLFSEDGFAISSKLREITPPRVLKIVKGIKRFRAEIEQSVATKAQPAIDLIRSAGLEIEDFYFGKQGIGTFFLKLSGGEVIMPNQRVVSTVNEDNWYAGKTDSIRRNSIDSVKDRLLSIYVDCNQILQNEFRNYKLLGMISNQLYQLGVISAIERELEEVKQERRVLHVSEFNKRITEIILAEPVPFIYERTGEKFKNYLIDEFQDTSDLQWKNLLPLIANSLASGHFNLVVGDGKQAIYRFRNGQVEQFMILPALPSGFDPIVFGDATVALSGNYQAELLGSNYRSLPVIVDFNNDFFRFVSAKLDETLKLVYKDQEQTPDPGKTGGYVSIEFLENDSLADFKELTLQRIWQQISDLTNQGYPFKDIVILTRSNIQGSTIARFLMKKGINVVSAEALLLATDAGVNFIIAVLRLLNKPDDVISAMAVIIYLDQRGKLPVRLDDLSGIIRQKHFDHFFRRCGFDFDPIRLKNIPLYDLCEEVIRIFNLAEPPYNPYIQFLLEFVSAQTSRESFQLPDLLESWEEKKTKLSVVVPEGIDAIRIMTIHKAKGLEFPVVIWPFATDTLKNTRDQLWIEPDHPVLDGLPLALVSTNKDLSDVGYEDLYNTERNKSLLDMVNLIYVAFTRPVERLIILTKKVGESKKESISLPALLAEYIAQEPGKWKVEGTHYWIGKNEATTKEMVSEPTTDSGIGNFISVAWQDRIRIARRAPDTWAAGHPLEYQVWGNLVHDCLARIYSPKDLEKCIRQVKEESQLPDDQIPELRKQLSSVITHEKLKPYFEDKLDTRPEASIILPDGTILRPDRIILDGTSATILEFKTGLPEEKHKKQLIRYAEVLEEMGFLQVKRFLVYISNQVKVEEV